MQSRHSFSSRAAELEGMVRAGGLSEPALRRQRERLLERLARVEATLEARAARRRAALTAAGAGEARRLAYAVAVAARLELRAERDERVRRLRREGLGYKRVARELGVSRDSARDLVRRVERGAA